MVEELLTGTPTTTSEAAPSEAAAENIVDDIKMIPIEEISIYGGTQARAGTNDDAIDSYMESIEGGESFPPVEVYFDGTKYWLADGFHRLLAYKRAGKVEIHSKNVNPQAQDKARQVSVPSAGIERQPRGGGGGSSGGGGTGGKSRQSSQEESANFDLDDFSTNEPPETTELSPFVYAENAIKFLSRIPRHDPDAQAAYARVMDWLKIHAKQSD